MGITVTLLLLKDNSEAHIGTNNVATILQLQDIQQDPYIEMWHGLILKIIQEMIRKKNLFIILYKIDAHSGHKWNDRTDELTYIGTGQQGIFKLNLAHIIQLSYHYKWDSIFADISIKETQKKIQKVEHATKVVNLMWHNISLNDRIRIKIDIELTAETLEYTKITYDKTSQNDQLIRKRIIKLFNNKLSMRYTWFQ